jgi:hypothetical protein
MSQWDGQPECSSGTHVWYFVTGMRSFDTVRRSSRRKQGYLRRIPYMIPGFSEQLARNYGPFQRSVP